MSEFWNRAVQAQQPAETAIRADAEGYRRLQAARSGSLVYSEAYQQARMGSVPPRSIYEPAPPKSLADYGKPTASKWARRADESGEAYLARTGAILRAIESLPEAEQALILETREAILTADPQTAQAAHDELRTIIDARQSAQGVKQEGHRVAADERFGTPSRIERLGGTAMPAPVSAARTASIVEIAAARRAEEQQRLASIPHRTDVSQLRSSADGLTVTNQ